MAATVMGTLSGVTRWQRAAWVRSRESAKTVLTVAGELDQRACAGLLAAALGALEADGEDVVLEMAGVEFIDAGALGLIEQMERRWVLRGRTLLVRTPSRPVGRLRDLTQLGDLIGRPDAMSELQVGHRCTS